MVGQVQRLTSRKESRIQLQTSGVSTLPQARRSHSNGGFLNGTIIDLSECGYSTTLKLETKTSSPRPRVARQSYGLSLEVGQKVYVTKKAPNTLEKA